MRLPERGHFSTFMRSLFAAVSICFLVAYSPALLSAGEVTPAIYLGYGTGTNIGGEIGIGTEVRFDQFFSVNAAIGIWNDMWPAHSGDQSKIDYDIGLKYYPFRRYLYLGLNYGVIGEELYTTGYSGSDVLYQFNKYHGFTFSGGARVPIFRPVYCSAFLGVTSSAKENSIGVFDQQPGMFPHFGVMLGCDLGTFHVDSL